MFMSSLQNALIFTVHTLFSTYIMIVLFRFLLQLVRGDFYNPLAKFAVKATNPILVPLRKIIPGYAKIDFASIVLAMLLQATELYLILLIQGFNIAPEAMAILGLFIWSAGELLDLFLVFIFYLVLIQVIFSWIQQGSYNQNFRLLSSLTEPLYKPIHKILPVFSGLDFSPLLLIFIIYLSRILLANPIIVYGKGLT